MSRPVNSWTVSSVTCPVDSFSYPAVEELKKTNPMKKSIKWLFVLLAYILLSMNVYGLKIILLWGIVVPIICLLEYFTSEYKDKLERARMWRNEY